MTERDVLKRLSDGLSEGEIQRVLAEALVSLDQDGLKRLAEKLGPETGATLLRALKGGGGKQAPVAGVAKVKQEWDRAWAEWNALIMEACDEEGDYVIQEHDWEQPYFDPLSVTHDLEPIAAKMRKLLPRVFDENLDPDFSFSEAVKDSVEEIGSSLPDWMDPFESEGFGLGPEATKCLLDWEWRCALRQDMAAFQFVDRLCAQEMSTKGLYLDAKTVADFIGGLTAQAKKDLFQGIQKSREKDPWKKALCSVHSRWFRIYEELCRSQDRPFYLENCRSRISQDWTLALPVIKDLQRREEYAEILKVCDVTLHSFLHLREGEQRDLRENLLFLRAGWSRSEEPDARLLELLGAWEQAAGNLKNEEMAVAIRLQIALLRDWRNWDKALAAFHHVPQPHFSALRERLFSQWRDLVAEKSLERCLDPWGKTQGPHWVHWLAEAAWEGPAGHESFQASLRRWLVEAERDAETLRRAEDVLARISLDIKGASWLSGVSPTLVRLLSYSWSDDRALSHSRRIWLERVGASSLAPELLSFWKRNLWRMIPDPAGSDYERCAEWARSLWEIDNVACRDLMGKWSVTHRRRRNLWKALRAKGLSVPVNQS